MGFSLRGVASFFGGKGTTFSNLTPGGVLDDLTGRRNMREQNDWNLRMWNLQNEYNSPKAQMQRFAEAGLNPNLIYTQGNAGNASAVASSASAGGLSQALGAVSKTFGSVMSAKNIMADIKNKQMQNENLKSQNTLIESQSAVAKAQAKKQQLENAFFEKNGYYPGSELPWVRTARSLFNFISGLPQEISVEGESVRQNRGLYSRGDLGNRVPVGH